MSGFTEWQLLPAVAAGLEQLGWRADEPAVIDAVPAVLRGGNAVAILPPAPAWAGPIFAAVLGQPSAAKGPVLILAAPALVGECATAVGALVESTGLEVEVARDVRAPGTVDGLRHRDVLIASPATALDRHVHSALKPDEFRAILFAWPEEWDADDAVTSLLQDFPRDAQRIVLTARPDLIDGPTGVVERYARKALILPGTAVEPAPAGPPRSMSVRTVPTSWAGRAFTVAAVLDAIGPAEITIWTADHRDHQLLRRTLGSLRKGVQIASRNVPAAGMVICYDPPSAGQLAQLAAAGEVVLLVAPGSEHHIARIAPLRRPMQLATPAMTVVERDTELREKIAATIETGNDTAALYALGPLFERYDPQQVAAALFGLWRHAPSERAAPAVPAPHQADRSPDAGGVAKIWIGAGKKDEATVGDFVAVLIKEAGMERGQIGRIELRDTFALVEVPAADAEGIVQRLTGMTIRKRKLSARVDRGRGGRSRRG